MVAHSSSEILGAITHRSIAAMIERWPSKRCIVPIQRGTRSQRELGCRRRVSRKRDPCAHLRPSALQPNAFILASMRIDNRALVAPRDGALGQFTRQQLYSDRRDSESRQPPTAVACGSPGRRCCRDGLLGDDRRRVITKCSLSARELGSVLAITTLPRAFAVPK